jgi:hypothetical protein
MGWDTTICLLRYLVFTVDQVGCVVNENKRAESGPLRIKGSHRGSGVTLIQIRRVRGPSNSQK